MSSLRVIISCVAGFLLIFCIANSCQTTADEEFRLMNLESGKIVKRHAKKFEYRRGWFGWRFWKRYGLHEHMIGEITNHIGGKGLVTPSRPGHTDDTSWSGNTGVSNLPGPTDSNRWPGNNGGPNYPGHTNGTNSPGNTGGSNHPGHTDGNRWPGNTGGSNHPEHMDGTNWPGNNGGQNHPGQTGGSNWPGNTGGPYNPGQTNGNRWPENTGDPNRPGQTDGTNWPGNNGAPNWPGHTDGNRWPVNTDGSNHPNWPGNTGGPNNPGHSNWPSNNGGPNYPGHTDGNRWPENTGDPNRPGNAGSPGSSVVNCGSPYSEISKPGSTNIQYPGLCDNNICPGSSHCGVLGVGLSYDTEILWYTLGEQLGDDYLIAEDSRECGHTDMVDFSMSLKYPLSGCEGLTVTFVTVSIESRNGANSVDIISGGIGGKTISINVTAQSTNIFYWKCRVFGYGSNYRDNGNSSIYASDHMKQFQLAARQINTERIIEP